MKSGQPRRRTTALRVIGGIALMLAGVFLYRALLTDLPVFTHEAGDRPENLLPLSGTQTIGQTIASPRTTLSGVELVMHGPQGVRLEGDVLFHLRRSPTDERDLRSAQVDAATLQRGAHTRFLFPPLPVEIGAPLYFFIEYPSGTDQRPLLIRAERPRTDNGSWNDYPRGTVRLAHQPDVGDLGFRLLARERLPFGVQVSAMGALGGLALLAGALARRAAAPATLVTLGVGLPLVFLLPLATNPTFLGVGDWDMNTTIATAAARALLQERTFPGWNPYLCGGTPLAAFPEAPVFSPFFGTVLLGGPVVGFKINIALHGIIGFLGMLYWLRYGFRTSWSAAFLGAATVMFSSFVALQLHEGHSRKIAIAWLPWVLALLQRATETEKVRYAAPAGAALALMALDGSVYLLSYTAFAVALLGGLKSACARRWLPLLAAGITLLVGGLLAGAHLVPAAASQAVLHPSLEPAAPPPLRALIDVFLDPNQHPNALKFDGQSLRWSEYGAYVGIVPVTLAVLGAVTAWRRLWPLLAVGALFLLGAVSPLVQHALQGVPLLGELRNQQRMVVLVTVAVGIAAALGMERLVRWLAAPPNEDRASRSARAALGVLAALVIGHFIYVNTETFASTFVVPSPPPRATRFRQGWAALRFAGTADSFPFTMENTARNQGSINRCSVAAVRPGALRLPPADHDREIAAEFTDKPYRGEAFLLTGKGTTTVQSQQTSAVSVDYAADTPATIVLNQNYHPGWAVTQGGADVAGQPTDAFPLRGLVATGVGPGRGTLLFTYRPPALGLGLLASAAGLGLALWIWKRS